MNRSALGKSRSVDHNLSEEHLWNDNVPIGMAILSEKNVLLRVNRALCRFLGYSKRELLGKTVRDITHPDDWGETAKKIRTLYSGRQSYSCFEKRYLHRNGKFVWGEVNSSLIGSERRTPRYRITHIVDITKRKAAEHALQLANERFQIALAGSPTVLFCQDQDLCYTWVYNPSPFFRPDAVLGKRDSDLLPFHDAKNITRIKRAVMKTGVGHRDEITLHLPPGETTFDLTTEPLHNAMGKIVGVRCAAVDITRRKQLEQALQKANEGLEQKVKDRTARLRQLTEELTKIEHQERRRIAHILHDDLQQHLCAMKFFSNDVKEKSSDQTVIALADRLLNELDYSINITRTLSTDLFPPVLNHMGFTESVEWIANDMKNRLGLRVKVCADKHIQFSSDEMRMFAFEAVRELLLNVVKHSTVKTAELHLRSIKGGLARIEVRDKGVGFSLHQHKEAENHLGLFRIQERAESFGCRCEIASQPNKGTCVTLILPCRDKD